MLTEHQKEVYDEFVKAIENREIKLLSSEQRAWGKSYILNELGLELQALGYRVFSLTEFANSQEHIATDVLRSDMDFRGTNRSKAVVLVDEYRFSRIKNILDFCLEIGMPVAGFIDYSK